MIQEKINIAELLKDCPKGMELDCAMFEDVFFDEITNNKIFPICIKRIDGFPVILTKYGGYANCPSSKCVIFPKGKTTWEGFVPPCKFKDGDIVYIKANGHNHNEFIIIFKEIKNDHIHKHACFAYQVLYTSPNAVCHLVDIEEIRIATEEEKQILFDAIKANGYKWNPETKTLEKLVEPKFKVGDKIRLKENHNYIYTITGIREEENKYECGVTFVLRFSEQDNWELVPNKFDITTLKPFDKVLVRLTNNCVWRPKFFSHYDTDPKVKYYPFVITDNIGYPQCIPYEKNEYLSNTTDDCDEFYKTWE